MIRNPILVGLCIYGLPDAYLPELKTMLFIDGCFWHRCITCGYPVDTAREDLRRKVQNDAKVTLRLLERGYRVFRVWEHEIREDLDSQVKRILTVE